MLPFPALLLLMLVIGLPVAWFIAEFRANRPTRIALGILALMCAFGVAGIVGLTTELDYNAWYGSATQDLISTTIGQIEDGHLDRVLTVLRGLNDQYQPTYENRANYRNLVEEATARMRGDTEIAPGSAWDGKPFDRSTWLGHWEDGSGFWLVVDHGDSLYTITLSSHPGQPVESARLSDDCRVLQFNDGTEWRYTLTLVTKYEAKEEWFDVEKGSVSQTNRLYKLVRPSAESKSVTPQAPEALPQDPPTT